jgi:hypothetical protein
MHWWKEKSKGIRPQKGIGISSFWFSPPLLFKNQLTKGLSTFKNLFFRKK